MTHQEQVKGNKKVYHKPAFKPLGALVEVTYGPSGGNIDAIALGTGGFQGTS